ncbi:MAG: FHIPEP family type III secretion protein [Deltaproteobacteria bacterium]|nr:FHIPEP family type III secretion protein [Deltaproteobacteria bacterium]MBN2670398.1 FHIPEP family type III secretion protein [Deltaproteobacteria bacterium]
MVSLISAIVAMMIIPLTPWLMDGLIALNISLSLLIFSLALFTRNPLRFSAFPTILLIATLFRLALNVSSTRLILTRADAGQIIGGFGGFVVGGDIIVGAVIFGIILMVLYLVITKGAERVAEVAARFTLDALPGMQLAIETDLRSKSISPRELTMRREVLEQRSMYYGSLDGAMKFVRGDAVAGLVITGINIVGGTLVGTFRKEMPFLDALDLYGRLTVGDGLVTMIPALLISTAAGLLVTRVAQGTSDDGLAEQIGSQLVSEPKALYAASIMMLAPALAPGLPAWPFLVAALGLAALAVGMTMLQRSVSQSVAHGQSGVAWQGRALGLDDVQQLLDDLATTHPVLVREVMGSGLSLSYLSEIVAECRRDGIDERFLRFVLEALARESVIADIDEMLIRIRKRMPHVIRESIGDAGQQVDAVVLEPASEQMLQASIVQTGAGKRLVLPSALRNDIFDAVRHRLPENGKLVLLTDAYVRRPLQRLLGEEVKNVAVIGHDELAPETELFLHPELSF